MIYIIYLEWQVHRRNQHIYVYVVYTVACAFHYSSLPWTQNRNVCLCLYWYRHFRTHIYIYINAHFNVNCFISFICINLGSSRCALSLLNGIPSCFYNLTHTNNNWIECLHKINKQIANTSFPGTFYKVHGGTHPMDYLWSVSDFKTLYSHSTLPHDPLPDYFSRSLGNMTLIGMRHTWTKQ